MKKLAVFSLAFCIAGMGFAQDSQNDKQKEFDKKFRFGLRATPQASWLSSKNESAKSGGVVSAFGFGLILDFRLSDIIHFSTGIGGDFDGGYIKYKYVQDNNNPSNDFTVNMVLDKENNMIEAKDGTKLEDYILKNGHQQLTLNDRRYKATYVTIPLLLKMMTQEYNGLRYVFLFGGEAGIRTGLKANDTYHKGFKTEIDGTNVTTKELTGDALTIKGINVGKDATLIPLRFGMNLGFGVEYRIAGSTSLYTSLNYFHSFTNLMRSSSKYLSRGVDNKVFSDGSIDFSNLGQNHLARAVRLSVGLMF